MFFQVLFLDKRDEIWYYILSWYWLFYTGTEKKPEEHHVRKEEA